MTPGAPALRVYVIHWHAPEWLRDSVETLLGSDIPVDVTVINNGPAGSDLALPVDVRVVEPGVNLGYAGGATWGVEEWIRTGEAHCVVAAHDARVEPHTLRTLVEVAEAHADLGIVGAAARPGGHGDLVDTRGDIEIRTWASGTCLLLRRDCIVEIGAFDTRFGSYGEDRELGLRATQAGWKVARVTRAPVEGRGSIIGDIAPRVLANRVLIALRYEGRRAAGRQWLLVAAVFGRRALLSLTPGRRGAVHRQTLGHYGASLLRATRFVVSVRGRRPPRPLSPTRSAPDGR